MDSIELRNTNNSIVNNSTLTTGENYALIISGSNNNIISNNNISGDSSNINRIWITENGFDQTIGGSNNIIINNTITSFPTLLRIDSNQPNNIIYGNTFASSNIISNSINNFSFNGIGNRYLNLNSSDLEAGGEYCINPTNCDFFPLLGPIFSNIQTSQSLFPIIGNLGIIISLVMLNLFFV